MKNCLFFQEKKCSFRDKNNTSLLQIGDYIIKMLKQKATFSFFPFVFLTSANIPAWHSAAANDKLLTFIISHFFSRKVVYVLWQEGIKGYFKTIIRKELDNYKELSRLSCENSRNTMIDGSKP